MTAELEILSSLEFEATYSLGSKDGVNRGFLLSAMKANKKNET